MTKQMQIKFNRVAANIKAGFIRMAVWVSSVAVGGV